MNDTLNPTTEATRATNDSANDAAEIAPRFRRRKWMLDPNLMIRYALHLVIVSVVATLAAGLYWMSRDLADAPTEIEPLRAWLTVIAARLGLIAAGAALITSFFISHRIAGPGCQLRRAARRVAAGERGFRVHLRQYDHLKATAAAFNEMLAALEEAETRAAQTNKQARAQIQAALQRLESGEAADLPEALRLLEEAAARLER